MGTYLYKKLHQPRVTWLLYIKMKRTWLEGEASPFSARWRAPLFGIYSIYGKNPMCMPSQGVPDFQLLRAKNRWLR
jgi:hypothetical protein